MSYFAIDYFDVVFSIPPYCYTRIPALKPYRFLSLIENVPARQAVLIEQGNPDRGPCFTGLTGYVTNPYLQKAMFCGTLIVPETRPVRDLAEVTSIL